MLYSVGPAKVVCPFDPAIDWQKSDVAKYTLGRDFDKLVFLPDQKPVVYHVRRLSSSKASILMQHADKDDETRVYRYAFAMCVIKIENYPMPDGSIVEYVPEWCRGLNTKNDILKDEEIDALGIPPDEIDDIGGVAYRRSFLRRGRPVFFVPPRSSVLALEIQAQSYHHAAASDLLSDRLRRRADITKMMPQSTPSESPTDVTAKENASPESQTQSTSS